MNKYRLRLYKTSAILWGKECLRFPTFDHWVRFAQFLHLGPMLDIDLNSLLTLSSGTSFFFSLSLRLLMERRSNRLPGNILPRHYDLNIAPDLQSFVISAQATIRVDVISPSAEIVLNAVDLNIKSVFLEQELQTLVPTVRIARDEEKVYLTFPSDLSTGCALLHFEYYTMLNDTLRGFYRSRCIGFDGEGTYAAVTHFEPACARMAFPCWDEPAFRATFDITIVCPRNLVALSNMPIKEERISTESLKSVTFCTTPLMSAYLVAFIIGPFDFVSGAASNGVEIRVFTPLGKQLQGEFALQIASEILPFYEDFFGVSYPLPKLDLVAVPDLLISAMENWGLLTFDESELLFDLSRSSDAHRLNVTLIVAHELSHMWFGNLVAIAWWNDLWLKEGFANWIQYQALDWLFPESRAWTQFVFGESLRCLQLDSFESTHAIDVDVGNADDIAEVFDSISYCKGKILRAKTANLWYITISGVRCTIVVRPRLK